MLTLAAVIPIVLFIARVFQNLPAPPKQYGVFDVFCDFQSFFQLENLGSHLAMCPDDRFLPQGKQILPEICQVRPMPFLYSPSTLDKKIDSRH